MAALRPLSRLLQSLTKRLPVGRPLEEVVQTQQKLLSCPNSAPNTHGKQRHNRSKRSVMNRLAVDFADLQKQKTGPPESSQVTLSNFHIVPVHNKVETLRTAEAQTEVSLGHKMFRHFYGPSEELTGTETFSKSMLNPRSQKGPIFTAAELAGIAAVKRTSELIPLCHNIPVASIGFSFTPVNARASIMVKVMVTSIARTGVEMEALVGASVAALTIYDMCKSLPSAEKVSIQNLRLISKTGGSGEAFSLAK